MSAYHFLFFFLGFFFLLVSFFTIALADGLSLEWSDSKSLQVSRILLSIPADLNHAVSWKLLILSLISNSSSSSSMPSGTVPRAQTTFDIIVSLSFFSFLVKWWLSLEMDTAIRVQILNEAVYISQRAHTFRERYESKYSPFSER